MGTRRVAKKNQPKTRKKAAPKKRMADVAKERKANVETKLRPDKDVVTGQQSKHVKTYELFIEYMALPTGIREDTFRHPETDEPLATQRDFAQAYKIDEALLSRFKLTEDYVNKVSQIRRRYFKGEIGDAIQAVLLNIIQNGRGADLKVLLDYANEIERDDPLGETSQVYADLLAKISKMIPD